MNLGLKLKYLKQTVKKAPKVNIKPVKIDMELPKKVIG